MDHPDSTWRPSADIETLRARARHLASVRAFFKARGVLEVETPVLGHGGSTDPHLASLSLEATTPAGQEQLWLQTSPEGHMKRLLAAGSGPIFQLARVFRDGEVGRRHNLEFTMLEWYRPGMAFDALIGETCDLIEHVLQADLPRCRHAYRALFQRHVGLDPMTASLDALQDRVAPHLGESCPDWSRDSCLDLLMSFEVEPHLGQGVIDIVTEYPASQAALAKCHSDPDGCQVASRFEVYVRGIELANGYDELIDACEQRQRFEADQRERRALGAPSVEADHHLVAALEYGLPPACGVALGLDRLIMLAEGRACVSDVMAFDTPRC
ncbi:EF-P lysine aminoacylase EpmA [Larsenimonas suaedae]|uniref:EF-P lysine aminoacylase EpmA n=1 Tax=Larsenimonas suaedae TaxID=1851019 RepID=A0ABU1GY58_9GAMM|nr:EF-P lysine aminoacylase EpmA [Larsenimonas suaedae]MCM2972870.1 EF-P lysine aminoacylase EpmA [Larsenimonas suaedae]MDR5896969.1 EF-P lysine aminoacylase EpmA [Larsenimonas suaedae]